VNYKVLAAGLVVVLPTLAVFWSSFGRDPHALPEALEGKQAPPFALMSLDGEPVDRSDLAGRPFVLNFWATWCIPCAQEHPALLEVARRYGDRIPFYGVLYGDDKEKARAWLDKRGSAFPTLMDPSGRTAIDYGVAGVPETFIVNARGEIVEKVVGPIDPTMVARVLETLQ
jgi:cytochrome c biogenesis protein CcmG, thiol:disulfide interchange protein DsbE